MQSIRRTIPSLSPRQRWYPARAGKTGISRHTTGIILSTAMMLAACSLAVRADEPTTRPALDQLNREVQSLYGKMQSGLVRVQLPRPHWLNNYALEPLNKYQQIDPQTLQRWLEQMQADALRQLDSDRAFPGQSPHSSGSNQSTSTASASTEPSSTQPAQIIIVTPPPALPVPPGGPGEKLELESQQKSDFTPTHVGLLLDDRGHVLVPMYLEPETCATQPIRLAMSDGQIVDAKFIGSDRQTNVTILQVAGDIGKPIPLGNRIDPGNVCLFVSPTNGSARLGLWTGGESDWGYVLATDGHVAGIARAGHMVCGRLCQLIADEIEHYGKVRRPAIGVAVKEVLVFDAAKNRHQYMRVEEVMPDSPAERAGVQVGDLLESIHGQPAGDVCSLAAAIVACQGKTEMQLLRDNQQITLTADLALPDPTTNPSK